MQVTPNQNSQAESAFQQGVIAIGQGKLKSALDLFNQACAVSEAVPRHQLYRAWTKYQMVVHEKKLTSNQRKAVQHSCRMTIIYALLQDRRFDAGYVLLGTVFIGEKKRERARQCFLKALSINPKNAGAQMGLKNCSSSR